MPIFAVPAFVGVALGSLGHAAPAAEVATNWEQIEVPPLHAFHPQLPKRIQFRNGMIIFLQEDHDLPLIRGTARIRGGSLNEPPDKVGLVEMYGEVWRTGGTKDRTGDQLDDFLGSHATKVETSGDLDSTTVHWDCLKDTFDDAFKVVVELLREPKFRDDKIASQEIARIAESSTGMTIPSTLHLARPPSWCTAPTRLTRGFPNTRPSRPSRARTCSPGITGSCILITSF